LRLIIFQARLEKEQAAIWPSIFQN